MKVAIIGFGVIGHKRIKALQKNDKLLALCDLDKKKIKKTFLYNSIKYFKSYKDLLRVKNIQVVIVSVINNQSFDIVMRCLQSNKMVLCEKPLGINSIQARKIHEFSYKKNLLVKVGFNHRFHPAIMLAKQYIEKGLIGKILNIRSYYGHGGRPGMEKEWRSSKNKCGGGELIDQGIHLIDLFRWFSNSEPTLINGKVWNSFWDIKVEDNAIFDLTMKNNILCFAHVSWTNWKNEFYFCLFGSKGYIRIDGLGGSYGDEKIEIGLRNKKGGKPHVKKKLFTGEDQSWKKEWSNFKMSIKQNCDPLGSSEDGLKAMSIIENIYKSSARQRAVRVNGKKL